ncbi:MAG TPA: hypothetical protein VF188_07875 [Longimicrobiales bacterium]
MDPKGTPTLHEITSPLAESRTVSGMRYIGNVYRCHPANAPDSRHTKKNAPIAGTAEIAREGRNGADPGPSNISSYITPGLRYPPLDSGEFPPAPSWPDRSIRARGDQRSGPAAVPAAVRASARRIVERLAMAGMWTVGV